ncbi:MAG: S8 family serine peptidase [Planctomycetes bacterium]|nr:S8 family serine peptidase [Planctomycetota bacterium]
MPFRSATCLLPLCLGIAVSAVATAQTLQYGAGAVEVRRTSQAGVERAEWSHDGGQHWRPLRAPDDLLHLRAATFDPLAGVPVWAPPLDAPAGSTLRLVQFHTQVLAAYRAEIEATGAEILYFLPASALLVRCDAAAAAAIAALPCVRWFGGVPNAVKLDAALQAFVLGGGTTKVACNLVLAAKADRLAVLAQVLQVGGQIVSPGDGSTMVRAALQPAQLVALLAFDTVVWADVAGADGTDMDRVRAIGGADAVELFGGYRGQGVRIDMTEAVDETHPDLLGRVLARGLNASDPHGHCVGSILGGSGAGLAAARGMLPDALLIEGAYNSANHYAVIQDSVDPLLGWRAQLATASWGAATTQFYDSVSMAMDDALFDADLPRLNSMGNNGNQLARPEAWAKNSISVGAVKHLNDTNPGNDRWNAPGDASAASIGPAADGRLKPDIVGFYDSIQTADLPGLPGFTITNYLTNFGGTSAAAPMVAGHVGIQLQMFTDGLFGNSLPLPATAANRFENRPHMTTAKALLCNTARQYPFVGVAHDLTRSHQGWGFPDLQRTWDQQRRIVVVDEYETLQTGEAREYWVHVEPGTPELRATLAWADPAALPAASIQLVNDLDLRVTRYADGAVWWGNHGLDGDTASKVGGAPNQRDTLESVYLKDPLPGAYLVRVEAASIVSDGKVETPQLDTDFALVMHPVGGYRNDTGFRFEFTSTGPGDLGFRCQNVPTTGWNDGFTAVSVSTGRGVGFGRFFGLEDDVVTYGMWSIPAFVGNPFHFVPGGTGAYPFTPFTFDPAFVGWLASYQLQLDAVVLLWNGDELVAASNVDRIQVQ